MRTLALASATLLTLWMAHLDRAAVRAQDARPAAAAAAAAPRALSHARPAPADPQAEEGTVTADDAMDDLPPAAWASDDPADSLYRAARAALADGDYRRAADLFHRIGATYPRSTYTGLALYYEAFALYRAGETADLHKALDALRQLSAAGRSPGAPDSRRGDAATLRTRICSALARQGDESCTVSIVQQAESAAAPLPDSQSCPSETDENDVRIAALNAFLQMDADRAMPILRKVLARRDACSVGLRRKALFLVSQKDEADHADILLAAARQDPSPEVRRQAVFWLSQIREPRVVDILDSIAARPGDQELREQALFALSQQESPRALAALKRVAERDDAPEALREKAVFWLGQSHAADGVAFLEDMFGRTTSASLKQKILFGISQHGGTGDWLLTIALDARQPDEVRKQAIFWASQGGVAIDRLLSLYDRADDSGVREQIVFALSQRKEPAAVDALMHIAKSDKDAEMRKRAVFWLGQSSDPRAAQFLQELISQ